MFPLKDATFPITLYSDSGRLYSSGDKHTKTATNILSHTHAHKREREGERERE